MRRTTIGRIGPIGLIGLMTLGCASAARAEGTGEGVLLRYHFRPGQEFRYRMTLNGDLPITPGNGAPTGGILLPAQIPTTMNGNYEWVQRVKSVSPDGVATVDLSVSKMNLTTSFLGMSLVARLGAGSQMEMLMNGQPLPVNGSPNRTIPDPLAEVRIDATGKVVGTNGAPAGSMSRLFGGQNITSIFSGGMPGMGMIQLPDQPLKPGDTWDTKTEIQVSVSPPGPAPGAATGPAPSAVITQTASVHNKLLRVEKGRAVIETQVTTSAPPGAKAPVPSGTGAPAGMTISIDKMDQSATGTEQFNVAQGVIESGDFNLKIASLMTLGMPGPGPAAAPNTPAEGAQPPAPDAAAPAAPPAFGAGAMRIGVDGTLKVKIDHVSTSPAAAH